MPKNSKKPANNPSGIDRGTKQGRVSVAAFYRARFPKELQEEFYNVVLEGKRPKMIHVDNCEHAECLGNADRCNKHFVAENDKDVYPNQLPTLDHMMLAVARIKDRAYGQAPQHTTIETEIKAEITAIAGGVDPRYFQRLSDDAINAIARAVRGVNAPPLPAASDRQLAEAVDVEFVTVEDDEGDDE